MMALPPPRSGVAPSQSVEALPPGSAATLPAKSKADDKKNKGKAREAPDSPPPQAVPLDAFQRGQLVSADAHADQMQQMQMNSATLTITRPGAGPELQQAPPFAPPRGQPAAPDRYQPNYAPAPVQYAPQPGYAPAPAQQPFNGNANLAPQFAPQPAAAQPVATGGIPAPPPKPKSKKPAAPPPQGNPAAGQPPARYDNNNFVCYISIV